MATFTKLRSGNWGLRGDAAELVTGETVTVTKRNGDESQETVGAIVWTDGEVAVAEIARKGASRGGRFGALDAAKAASPIQTIDLRNGGFGVKGPASMIVEGQAVEIPAMLGGPGRKAEVVMRKVFVTRIVWTDGETTIAQYENEIARCQVADKIASLNAQ